MLKVLKPQIKQRVREDELLQAKIATNTKTKISTVKRWLREDHILLTTAVVLDTVRDHLGLSKRDELTQLKEEDIAEAAA